MFNPEVQPDFKVGADFGSDPEQACEVLHRVANAYLVALERPAPQVLLRQFADGTIVLELRASPLFSWGSPELLVEPDGAKVREFMKEGFAFANAHLSVQVRPAMQDQDVVGAAA